MYISNQLLHVRDFSEIIKGGREEGQNLKGLTRYGQNIIFLL